MTTMSHLGQHGRGRFISSRTTIMSCTWCYTKWNQSALNIEALPGHPPHRASYVVCFPQEGELLGTGIIRGVGGPSGRTRPPCDGPDYGRPRTLTSVPHCTWVIGLTGGSVTGRCVPTPSSRHTWDSMGGGGSFPQGPLSCPARDVTRSGTRVRSILRPSLGTPPTGQAMSCAFRRKENC